jgi:hypothetical protein
MGMNHDHLEKASRHIAEGERCVANQRSLIARMAAKGLDTVLDESVLARMLVSLRMVQQHRQRILVAIAAGRD